MFSCEMVSVRLIDGVIKCGVAASSWHVLRDNAKATRGKMAAPVHPFRAQRENRNRKCELWNLSLWAHVCYVTYSVRAGMHIQTHMPVVSTDRSRDQAIVDHEIVSDRKFLVTYIAKRCTQETPSGFRKA